ncbi:MAG: hypothetical protein ACLVAT_10750 [Lachnospiraceae bacterium]
MLIREGEEVSVDMKIHFHETIHGTGWCSLSRSKDLKGTESHAEPIRSVGERTPGKVHRRRGETRRITFTQKMPLEAGEYAVSRMYRVTEMAILPYSTGCMMYVI